MTDKELFDLLDPDAWQERPLQKVFVFNDLDEKEVSREEIRGTLFMKIKKWAGDHLDKIENPVLEYFKEEDSKLAVQLRFTIKK